MGITLSGSVPLKRIQSILGHRRTAILGSIGIQSILGHRRTAILGSIGIQSILGHKKTPTTFISGVSGFVYLRSNNKHTKTPPFNMMVVG